MPLEAGVEVISVNSLAFRRFLDIARLLAIETFVVTDNDGSTEKVKAKFAEYNAAANIHLCYSPDESLKTLENHILELNGRDKLNGLFGRAFATDEELLRFMLDNKTDCALRVFDSPEALAMPEYIQDAVR